MSADNIDQWLKRFRACDAQEEEIIDDSAHYRSLLRQDGTPQPAGASEETHAHRRRKH